MVNRRPSASFTLEGPGSIIRTTVDEIVIVLSGILRVFKILQEIESVI